MTASRSPTPLADATSPSPPPVKRISITPRDDAHWHALRTRDITSTDCAALFNASPYATAFEVWHTKRDGEPVSIEDNERMEMGRELEPVIARLFARRYGVKVRSLNRYVRIDLDGFGHGIGANFDFEIVGLADDWTGDDSSVRAMYEQYGPGNLECKNVDWFVHKRGWTEDDAPDHIEFQVQHQLECIGRKWGVIAALIGGNTLRKIVRRRDPEFGAVLREKATEFWQSIAMNQPPEPLMPDDAAAVIALYSHAEPGKASDMRGDEDFAALAAAYADAHEREKLADEDKKVARAEILRIVGDAEKIVTDGYKISAHIVAPSEGKLITADMVGTRVGGRNGVRGFRLTPTKENTA